MLIILNLIANISVQRASMAVKIFVLLTLISFAFAIKILKYEISQNNKNLVEAFQAIRNDFVKNFKSKGFNLVLIKNPKNNEIYEAVKLEIIKNAFKSESVKICYIDYTYYGHNRNSAILVDNIGDYRTAAPHIDVKKFQYAAFHTVILLDGNLEDVHEIFSNFWSKSIFNVMILINYNGTLLLGTEPFENPQKCGDTTPKIINRFENGNFIEELM